VGDNHQAGTLREVSIVALDGGPITKKEVSKITTHNLKGLYEAI